MCPTARSRRDIYNEHVKSEKGCKIGLETSKVRMSLRNEHFQNAARGPLKYVGPGPSEVSARRQGAEASSGMCSLDLGLFSWIYVLF